MHGGKYSVLERVVVELKEILVEAKFCSGYIMANAMWVASGLPHATTLFLPANGKGKKRSLRDKMTHQQLRSTCEAGFLAL